MRKKRENMVQMKFQMVVTVYPNFTRVAAGGVVTDYESSMAEIMARNSSAFFARGTTIIVSVDMGLSTLMFKLLQDGGVEVSRSC